MAFHRLTPSACPPCGYLPCCPHGCSGASGPHRNLGSGLFHFSTAPTTTTCLISKR